MEGVITFFKDGYEWMLSGIVPATITLIVTLVVGGAVTMKVRNRQTQKVGKNGVGIQVGGDFKIGERNNDR